MLYLLAFPIVLMGSVQMVFAALSLTWFDDLQHLKFFIPSVAMMSVGVSLLFLAKRFDVRQIGFRDSLIFATLTWIICGFLGSIPIVLITDVSITDGVFEAVSGITTTGATILTGLEDMPRSFLLYRQFLQWLGGLGVVIFVVAVLPMLNVGGMKLLKSEMPGPVKDDKLSPRIASTAHYLWFVYALLTAACAISYYLGGMSGFDALAHSFTTVATGGFSTHDASMSHFDSPLILIIADVFMLLGAISFALHFRFLSSKTIRLYWRDEETRSFLAIVLCMILGMLLFLTINGQYSDPLTAVNNATFVLISFITSTGYGISDIGEWPAAVLFMLVVAGFLGGCSGSTTGGSKIIRHVMSIKLINLEIKRLIHPDGVFVVKYQGRPVEPSVMSAVMGFMTISAASTLIFTILLMLTGLDFWSAFTGAAACLNVLGPAFGDLGNNFQPVSDVGTWMLSFAMIFGRLEFFTVLALFLPKFWRH